jgi:hypothetical protein
MTRIQKLTGIALFAIIIGGGMGVAFGAGKPHAAVVARNADGSMPACVEGTFEWRWNVPGATCEVKGEAN